MATAAQGNRGEGLTIDLSSVTVTCTLLLTMSNPAVASNGAQRLRAGGRGWFTRRRTMTILEELRWRGTGTRTIRIAGFGHGLYAVTLITLGIMGLIKGSYAPIWSGVPKAFPARVAVIYLCAVVSLGSGVALLWNRAAGIAARALLAYLALWMLVFRVPLIFRDPTSKGAWWVCGETAAMMAGAWVLVVWFAGDRGGKGPGFVTGEKALAIARVLYGLGLIAFGVAHFTFLERTVGMVPSWLPWHLGWAYFTGGAMIAAGIAIIVGVWARLAAVLSAWELSLFTLLVWVPYIVAGPNADQFDEFVGSCALTAAAWLVADSYRRGTQLNQTALPERMEVT